MKRILFFLFAALPFVSANSQTIMGRQLVDQFPRNSSGTLEFGLTWLPAGYNFTGTKTYPLLLVLHGAGETGTIQSDLSKLYSGTTGSVTPTGRIASGWNATAINPLTGLRDSFIVISPQAQNWSTVYDGTGQTSQAKYILANILQRYRIDSLRIYGWGVSAGGSGLFTILGSQDSAFIKLFAAMIPVSSAGVLAANGYSDIQVEANLRSASKLWGVRVWSITGDGDSFLDTDVRYHDSTNKLSPAIPNKLTVISGVGHTAAAQASDTTFRPRINSYANNSNCTSGCAGITAPNSIGTAVVGTGKTQDSLNFAEWYLTIKRTVPPATSPTSNAGNNQSITLPANQISLTGSGTAGSGHTIQSVLWTRVSGPNTPTIVTPNQNTTNITGLIQGVYVFTFTVTNEVPVSAGANVQITVNAAPSNPDNQAPVVSVGSDQVVTQPPTSSVALTSTPIDFDGTISSQNWTKLLIPGQAKFHIGVMGSSTTQGSGTSNPATKSFVNLLKAYYKGLGIIDTIYNIGSSGTNIYNGTTSSFTPPGPTANSSDPTLNITNLLSKNPSVIIVNYPTNFYELPPTGFSITEIMAAARNIYNTSVAAGVPCFITGTQPRAQFDTASQRRLNVINDSFRLAFGFHFLDFNTPVRKPQGVYDTVQLRYDAFDDIHENDAGHAVFAEIVKAKNIFQELIAGTATIQTPTLANTNINSLNVGIHKFQIGVFDNFGQAVSAINTVTVNANPGPVANAGINRTIQLPKDSVHLSASGSTGTITSYTWTQIGGPNTATLSGASTVNLTATLMIAGTYTFQVSLNSGASTSQVQIIVQPAHGCGNGIKYTISPGAGDSSVYIDVSTTPSSNLYIGGDTLVFTNNYSAIDLVGIRGSSACPVVIINGASGSTPTLITTRLKLENCKNIKLTGTGNAASYGFLMQGHPYLRYRKGFAIDVTGRSSNIEIEKVKMRNVDIGIRVETDGGCVDSLNFPAWEMDSIFIHDNFISGTWNEGMYIGNTSPDNGPNSYDVRPVNCNGNIVYPIPMRNGFTYIYNNFVDSTGRAGIQMASTSGGVSEIHHNTIKHNGLNGDDAQGAAINLGTYTHVYIHDNFIRNTLTCGVSSFGASGFNIPLRIENNNIDSSGDLINYPALATAPDTKTFYDPNTEPTIADPFTWPQSILVTTKQTGNSDSTLVYLKLNVTGRHRNVNALAIENEFGTLQKSGHIICSNTNLIGGALSTFNVISGISYTTACNGQAVANAGVDQLINLPTNSVTVFGSGSLAATTYSWTKISGPVTFTIVASTSSSTAITGLVAGVYQFQLQVNGGSLDTVQITVNQQPSINSGTDKLITLPTSGVTLNGLATDADGTVSGVVWSKVSGPNTPVIAANTSLNTTVTGLVAGTYVFRLTATDNNGATNTDDISVVVNIPPTVTISRNQITIVVPQDTVHLISIGADSDGTISSYSWTKLSGATCTIASPTVDTTIVSSLATGTYVFQMAVTDNRGAITTANVTVQVDAVPQTNRNYFIIRIQIQKN